MDETYPFKETNSYCFWLKQVLPAPLAPASERGIPDIEFHLGFR